MRFSNLHSHLLAALVLSGLFTNLNAQMAGGRDNNSIAPGTSVSASELTGGGISGDVNVMNGAYSSSYSLGSVSTPGGLSFNLNMGYSAAFASGDNPSVATGIPYGEGWDVDLPRVSVSTDAYLKYSKSELNSIQTALPSANTTQEFNTIEATREGELYWFAPQIHVPGVVSGRAIFKFEDNNGPVFVCNQFDRYAELRFFGSHVTLTTDDGTVFTFNVLETKWRAPSNQRAFGYGNQEDIIGGNMSATEKAALRNLVIPKEERTVWYCSEIYNQNIPSKQTVRFTYEKYGEFNYFKEYLQPEVYNELTSQIGPTLLPFFPDTKSYSDVFLKKVESYSNFSVIDVIELDYGTVGSNLVGNNMLDFRSVTEDVFRKDSLWSYQTVYTQNNSSEIFSNWKKYIHQKSDDANNIGSNNVIDPTNPYVFNGEYKRLAANVQSNPGIPFNHSFLESPRIGNTASDKLVPGDIYEIKTTIYNDNISANVVNDKGIGNLDINLATDLVQGADENTSLSIVPVNTYNEYREESVFNTFNQAIKWNTGARQYAGADAKYTYTSNYFVMPNLPEEYKGFHIQVGPANSDNDFSMDASDPINGMAYPVSGQTIASAYKSYVFDKNTSVNGGTVTGGDNQKGLLSGDFIQSNFGIGMPWALVNTIYNPIAGGHDQGNVSESNQYRFWWNDYPTAGSWENEPTAFDENVYLTEVELVRYSKNPYMLQNVKTYKVNGKLDVLSNDENILVSQVNMAYDVQDLAYAENKNYAAGEQLDYQKSQNVFTLNKIRQIPTTPTVHNEPDLSTVNLDEQLTIHLDYTDLGQFTTAYEEVAFELDGNDNIVSTTNLNEIVINRPGVVLTQVVDQMGGVTDIEYNDPTHFSTVVTSRYNAPTIYSTTWDRGKQQALDVRPTVKSITRQDDVINNPLAKKTDYEYFPNRIVKAEQFKLNDHFRNNSIMSSQVGFKKTKVLLPEIELGVRPYAIYHHIGFERGSLPAGATPTEIDTWVNQTPTEREYLLHGKIEKIEQFDANDNLVEETEIDWEYTLAYENAVTRPSFKKELGQFDYEDYYLGYSAFDPMSMQSTVGSGVPNANITVLVTLLEIKSPVETVLYVETFDVLTNNDGHYSFTLGEGTYQSGDIDAINWGDNIFLRIADNAQNNFPFPFTIRSTELFTNFPEVQAFKGIERPYGMPKFYEFSFYQDFIDDNASFLTNSYFIKKASETNRKYDQGCAKGNQPGTPPPIIYPEVFVNPAIPFVNPTVNHVNKAALISQINTLTGERLRDTLINNSPLSDTLLFVYINKEANDHPKAVKNVLKQQPALSDVVLLTFLNALQVDDTKFFTKVIKEQPQVTDNVLTTLLSKSAILPSIAIKKAFEVNEHNSTALIYQIIDDLSLTEAVKGILNHEGQLSADLLIRVIERQPHFKGEIFRKLLNKQTNIQDPVYMALINSDIPSKYGIIQKVITKGRSYPSDAVLLEIINRNGQLPIKALLPTLKANPYPPSSEIIAALEVKKYPPAFIDLIREINIGLNPLLAQCNKQVVELPLSIESITEYEYYEADANGVTHNDAYKNLMGLEDYETVTLKHEPSWQVYKTKTYSPQYPGAFQENENFYYFDLRNRYQQHIGYYDVDFGYVGIDGQTGAQYYYTEEGLLSATGDTIVVNNSSTFPQLAGTAGTLFPNPDGLIKSQEYSLRNIPFQNRITTKNNADEYALEKSTYYYYDSKWNRIEDPTYIVKPFQLPDCPEDSSLEGGNIFEQSGCEMINFKTWSKLEDDVNMFQCAVVDVNSTEYDHPLYLCPSTSIPDVVGLEFLLCKPTDVIYDYELKLAPIADNLTKSMLLRDVVTQIDTVYKDGFSDRMYFEVKRPIMDFSYFGVDDDLRHRWEPIYPYDTLRTQHILERNEYGQVSLESDVEGIRTKYFFDERIVEDWVDDRCPANDYRCYRVTNIGVPNKIVVGFDRPDALTTTFTYYPSYHVKSTVDPYNIEMRYEYDDLGRLFQTFEENRLLSTNKYHYWDNNDQLSFRERAKQNFVETITFNDENHQSYEVTAAFFDPLGRTHNIISFGQEIAPNGTIYTIPNQYQSSGEIVYDNWDRTTKAYKPFTYVMQGADQLLIPRLNRVDYDGNGAQGPNLFTEAVYEGDQRSRPLYSSKMGEDITTNIKVKNRYKIINYLQFACEVELNAFEQDLMLPDNEWNYYYTRVETEDEDGKIVVQFANAIGQKVATMQHPNSTDKAVTLFYYDSYGNLNRVINPEKQETNYSYNILGQLYQKETVDDGLTKYMYNKRGLVTLSQDARGFEGEVIPTENNRQFFRQYEYDDYGRLTSQQKRDLTDGVNLFPGNQTILTPISPLLYENFETGVNGLGSDYATYVFSNNSTYDWAATVVAPKFTGQYTGTGDMVFEPGDVLVIGYLDKTIQEKEWQYELKGRLLQTKDWADHDFANFGEATNPILQCNYTYDYLGRMSKQTQTFNENGLGGEDLVIAIRNTEYNLKGALLTQNVDVFDDGLHDFQYHYEYDSYNRLNNVYANYDKSEAAGNLLASYSYNDALQLLTKTNYFHDCGDGTDVEIDEITYNYDVRDRLTNMNSVLFNYNMYYNNDLPMYQGAALVADNNYNGNINGIEATYTMQNATNYAGILDQVFAEPTYYGYTYDGMNRLIAADGIVGDEVTGQTIGSEWFTYGDVALDYDLIGNINHINRYKLYDGTGFNNNTDEWDYNYQVGTNRLAQVQGFGLSADRNYTYDANGNMTADDHRGITATNYGRANYPFELTMADQNVDYLYNNGNQRIYKKTVNTTNNAITREFYLLNPEGQTIGILDRQAQEFTWYVNGASRFAKIKPNTDQQPYTAVGAKSGLTNTFLDEVSYYIQDHLGNTRIVYNGSVNNCDAQTPEYTIEYAGDYFPYGKILREFKGVEEKFLTTHHERDSETGLDYRGARYYDSDLGRFLSLDPMAVNYPSLSDYNYVAGKPVMFVDPDGKSATCPTCPEDDSDYDKFRSSKIDFVLNKDGSVSNKKLMEMRQYLQQQMDDLQQQIDDMTVTPLVNTLIYDALKAWERWDARMRAKGGGYVDKKVETYTDKDRGGLDGQMRYQYTEGTDRESIYSESTPEKRKKKTVYGVTGAKGAQQGKTVVDDSVTTFTPNGEKVKVQYDDFGEDGNTDKGVVIKD